MKLGEGNPKKWAADRVFRRGGSTSVPGDTRKTSEEGKELPKSPILQEGGANCKTAVHSGHAVSGAN